MSKLLINEHPQMFIPSLAKKIGLNEAIVLQQIHYWTELNKASDKNFKDGYYWTFNSYSEWKIQFDYWSQKTIQRIFENLRKLHLIVVGNYNKFKYDRTIWYRIDYKVLEELEKQPFSQIDHTIWTNWLKQLDILTSPIPEITTKTSAKTNTYIILPNDDMYVSFYLQECNRKTKKEHPRVRVKDIEYIEDSIERIKETVDFDIWKDAVREHFKRLPRNNNGNILAFLKASFRYFECILEERGA